MMPWWKDAAIGVGGPVASLPREGELGGLLAQVDDREDAALAFSRAVGVMAHCRRAALALGSLAGEDGSDEASAPTSADTGRALATDHAWTPLLAGIFEHGPLRLQVESCLVLAERQVELPWTVLPRALHAGRHASALRGALLPALGARGRWLAAQNPDWSFAAGGADPDAGSDVWQHGTLEQRLAWFRALRERDPTHARQLLAEELDEQPAKERQAFVECLAVGLGDDDETLLAPLLKDRARDVRHAAACLLASLPQSAHARQLQAWLGACVQRKRGLLGASWQCEAPASADSAWPDAAIETKRPQHDTLGERAWWLYQLARQVPLRWWNEHTGMEAAALLAWAGKGDWSEALHRAWHERVGAGDRDWIEAMLAAKAHHHARTALLGLLPPAARERHWAQTLEAACERNELHDVVACCAPGQTLSATYSRVLIGGLPALLRSDRLHRDYGLRAVLPELACVFHPDSLADWRPPPRRDDQTPAVAECVDGVERILAARLRLHAPMPAPTNPTATPEHR